MTEATVVHVDPEPATVPVRAPVQASVSLASGELGLFVMVDLHVNIRRLGLDADGARQLATALLEIAARIETKQVSK